MWGRLGHEHLIYESLYFCFENQPVWGSVCLLARQSQESTKGRTKFPKLVNLTGWESAESLCPRRWLAAVLWLLKHKGLHRCPVASGATNRRKRGHFKNKETMSTDPCLHVLHASLRKLIFIILWVQPLFQNWTKHIEVSKNYVMICDTATQMRNGGNERWALACQDHGAKARLARLQKEKAWAESNIFQEPCKVWGPKCKKRQMVF